MNHPPISCAVALYTRIIANPTLGLKVGPISKARPVDVIALMVTNGTNYRTGLLAAIGDAVVTTNLYVQRANSMRLIYGVQWLAVGLSLVQRYSPLI